MNNIPHQDTPTEAADDVLAFGFTHPEALCETSRALRVARPAAKPDCQYALAHSIWSEFIRNRVEVAA